MIHTVKPTPSLERRFWEKVQKAGPDECWRWTAHGHSRGYGFIRSGSGFRAPKLYAHRLSWALHYGEVPEGMHVCHRCDNPACVNPAHLFLGSHSDNMRDKVRKGRANIPNGERHWSAKLDAVQVAEIRALYAEGRTTMQRLAWRYHVNRNTVRKIVRGLSWTGGL